MIISIVNRSKDIDDTCLQGVIRAINRQIAEDFKPYWSFGGTLRLEGAIGRDPDITSLVELRGDAVIYLWDKPDMADALGYHSDNARGIPYGFVFTELSKELGEHWSVTLSHEALELVGDAHVNLLVQGPHPQNLAAQVFHWFEMCDAVQTQSYTIDGVAVANFLLPLYFTTEEQEGGRNDFLGQKDPSGGTLKSFGVSPGGYIGYFDPLLRTQLTYAAPGDELAKKRIAVKGRNAYGRGYLRNHCEATSVTEDAHLRAILSGGVIKASATPPADPIKHIVVLMLENRSFDHMLGGMTRFNPAVEGIDRSAPPRTNTTGDGRTVIQKPGAVDALADKGDPKHEFADVLKQLGAAANPMSGFAENFRQANPEATDDELDQILAYFDFGVDAKDDALPVLHTLARNFAVCDHWFASMPGPTWQNRFFAHSGTSLGHILMPTRQTPQDMRIYFQETIYDRLSDANISWKIFHDGIPQSIVLTRLLTRYLSWRGYAGMDQFYALAKGPPEDFPEFSFIEPRYLGATENDQHPPANVHQGEALIASVYNAIRQNEALWAQTLLVVTYDEHGGFYDHVSPPTAVPPDDHTAEYAFDRLGVRVPAILVSPWVDPGVTKTVFDHTSLLKYLCDKWSLKYLGNRTAAANSLAPELGRRCSARTDAPLPDLVAKTVPAARGLTEPPVAGSREALLLYVEQLPEAGPTPARGSRGLKAKPATAGEARPDDLSEDKALAKLAALRGTTPPSAPGSAAPVATKPKKTRQPRKSLAATKAG